MLAAHPAFAAILGLASLAALCFALAQKTATPVRRAVRVTAPARRDPLAKRRN